VETFYKISLLYPTLQQPDSTRQPPESPHPQPNSLPTLNNPEPIPDENQHDFWRECTADDRLIRIIVEIASTIQNVTYYSVNTEVCVEFRFCDFKWKQIMFYPESIRKTLKVFHRFSHFTELQQNLTNNTVSSMVPHCPGKSYMSRKFIFQFKIDIIPIRYLH
jgi:hypothetical protein